jgi:hypothetical protein
MTVPQVSEQIHALETCPTRRLFVALERDHRMLIEFTEKEGLRVQFWHTVGFLLCQNARFEHEDNCPVCAGRA